MEPPPQVIRPQQALNERETIETEVISAFEPREFFSFQLNHHYRASNPLLLQHHQAGDD